MYKKTFMVGFAGLASAGSWSGSSGSMPSCWSSCFASNGVTSEAACCGNDALSKCVHDTCSSADDSSYWTWYDSYCSASTTSSTVSATTPVGYSTTTSPVSTTTSPVETSPIETTPTTTIPTSPVTTSTTTASTSTTTPTCWTECFQENGIESESSLCGNTAVDSCIQQKCSSADDESYWSWYDSFCTSSTTTSPTSTPSTTVQTTPTTTPVSPTSPTTTPVSPTSPTTTSPATSTPTCWTECFQENGVQSESSLCGNTAVDSCIQQKCSSEDDKSYWSWYDSFCTSTTSSTQSATTPTSPISSPTTPATTLQTTTSPVSPTSPTTTSPATPTPTCWTECFQENNISSESQLCGNTGVDSCIQQKCSASEDQAYWNWYLSFCPAPTSPVSSTQTPTSPVSSPTGGVSTATTTETTPAGSTPTADCWSACFAKYSVQSEASLCSNDQVSACIHDTCSSELDRAYWVWYNSFCSQPTSSSVITSSYTTTPVGATTPVVSTTTYISTITIPSTPKGTPSGGLPTPYQTSPAQGSPSAPASPVGTGQGTPAAPGYPTSSAVGAQGTPVAPGSGSPSYPAGAVGGAPSGYPSGTAAASGSWPSASGYAPVAATGDGIANKPGVLFAAAMVLVALF